MSVSLTKISFLIGYQLLLEHLCILGEDGSDITVEVSGEENLDLSLNSNLEFLESEEGHHHAHHNICK